MIKKILILLFLINITNTVFSSSSFDNEEIPANLNNDEDNDEDNDKDNDNHEEEEIKIDIIDRIKNLIDIEDEDPCKEGPCFTAPNYDRIDCNEVTYASSIGDECFDNKSEFGGACHITYNICDEYFNEEIKYTSKTFVKCWCP